MMPQIEGFFASPNPYAVQVGGPIAWRAGHEGLAIARFGWGDRDTGFIDNIRSNAQQILGFVFPVVNGVGAFRVCRTTRFVRPGISVTFMRGGDFWARFPGGAEPGQPVYASSIDGTPISGVASSAEATRWFVASYASPGGLAIISTSTMVTS